MADNFRDPMMKDLEAAKAARNGAGGGPDGRSAEALGQIADTLIQMRWEIEDIRATMRAIAMSLTRAR